MATSQTSGVLQYLRRAVLLRNAAGLTDEQLLEAYLSSRDQSALAALVHRHGPMVWGVCRRILGNYHETEDAFQATFLVLVRKAASIASRELLANWLYGVAHQTALKARSTAAKRKYRERQMADMPEPAVPEQEHWRDLRPLLDQELSRLPNKYRSVVVLCDLEGRPRKEAARQLGVPEGTVAGWLARARALLAKRLARRGLAVPGEAVAGLLLRQAASACVPTAVLSATLEAVILVSAGQAAAGLISAKAVALTEGVLKVMLWNKFKVATASLLLIALVGVGAVGVARQTRAAAGAETANQVQSTDEHSPQRKQDRGKEGNNRTASSEGTGRLGAGGEAAPVRRMMHADWVISVCFSPDGKILASGSVDKMIKLWDVKTGEEKASLHGHQSAVHSVAFSPDGKMLASAGVDKTIRLWDVKTGKEKSCLRGHKEWVGPVVFSPDGKLLASGGGDKTIRLWDVKTGKEKAVLEGHLMVVFTVAFSPDGKVLASGSYDKTIRLWDVTTGKALDLVYGHKDGVRSVVFSPDGKSLASGSSDRDHPIKLWDVKTLKQTAVLNGHKDGVGVMKLSPDGKVLASASWDKTIRLWDVWTRLELASFPGPEEGAASLAFSPDGKLLASGGADKTVRLWDLKAGRELTTPR